MLEGSLSTTGIAEILEQLSADVASGCLHVDGDAGEALVYLRAGAVYAMTVPGRRPSLGARLVSAGLLARDSLYDIVAIQHAEMPEWRLSELLLHLGYVEPEPVEAAVADLLLDCCIDLLGWASGHWRFRRSERTREDVGVPFVVADLLEQAASRMAAVALEAQHPADALHAAGREAEEIARQEAVKEKGRRTPADGARREAEAFLSDFTQYVRSTSAANRPLEPYPVAVPPATTSDEPAAAVTGVVPAPSATADEEPAPPAIVIVNAGIEEETDTASLMWELSSLGRAEKPRPPTRPPAPRPAPPDPAVAKRRRGRFGR